MKEKQDIKIDSEFQFLIPMISDDEYRELEESIKCEGCRDALITFKGSLLDGHNRYKICQEHKIDFKTVEVTGVKSRDEAKLWIIRNQFARRNLTTWQKALMALKLKPMIEKEAIKRQKGGKVVQESEQGRTIDKVAEIAGVSKDTIWKVENIHKLIEKERIHKSIKENLETGKSSINEVWTIFAKKKMPETQLELKGLIKSKTISELITKIGTKTRILTNDFNYLNGYMHQIKIKKDDTRFWHAQFFFNLVYLCQALEEFRTGEEIDEQEIMTEWKKWLPEPSEETPPKKLFKENKK